MTAMKKAFVGLVGLMVVGVAANYVPSSHPGGRHSSREASRASAPPSSSDADGAIQERIEAVYASLPMSFEANHGQAGADVSFLSRGQGYQLSLSPTAAVLNLKRRDSQIQAELNLRLVGSTPRPVIQGTEPLPGVANYLVGNDQAKWRTEIPTYAKVVSRGVYPGIDLAWYGNHGELEYDFVVAPGADPGAILMSFGGAKDVVIDSAGDLVISTPGGEVRQRKPVIYQDHGGTKTPVSGSFVLRADKQVGFVVGDYDTSAPLVIDPVVLVYSTYLAGGTRELGFGVTVDSSGNTYVTGETGSSSANPPPFPTTDGAYDRTCGTDDRCNPEFAYKADAFVTKLNPEGSALIYSTYLGGSGHDVARDIGVDAEGHAYVTGHTQASTTLPSDENFPTTPGAFASLLPPPTGGVFVTKLNPAGSGLVYSTVFGPTPPYSASGEGIAVDPSGQAYITGWSAEGFPTTPGAFKMAPTPSDVDSIPFHAFVSKLNHQGSDLLYSTYLGQSYVEDFDHIEPDRQNEDIALDSEGNAYVVGTTTSPVFPTTPGALRTTFNASEAQEVFVSKIRPAGNGPYDLVYSTYLGGESSEWAGGVSVDSEGSAYVVGRTTVGDANSSFPTTSGAFDTDFNGGGQDAFVAKLNPQGSALTYSTYLGGDDGDQAYGVAVGASGSAYVTGRTYSPNFPLTPGGSVGVGVAGGRAFVTKLNTEGSQLSFSAVLQASTSGVGHSVAVGPSSDAYVTGITTNSGSSLTTPGAFQRTAPIQKLYSAFVARLGVAPTLAFTERSATDGQYSDTAVVEVRLTDDDGSSIAGAEVVFELSGAGGSRRVSAVTDSQGLASANLILDLRPGPYQLVAAYPVRPGTSTAAGFAIGKEQSLTSLSVAGKPGKRVLVARLTDFDDPNNPLTNRSVRFFAGGVDIGVATTGTDGVARLTPPPAYQKGKQKYEARFGGDDFYLGSSAVTTTS